VIGLVSTLAAEPALGQSAHATDSGEADRPPAVNVLPFLAGVTLGLGAHEAGHLFMNVVFDAGPGIKKVTFAGVPFFAITHRPGLSPRREYAVSASGFWAQHALSEWVLTRRPGVRHEDGSVLKGVLAFHVATSVVYTVGAVGRMGPDERDTRAMAASRRLEEPWIGALVLAPAALDTYRYFEPDAPWAIWLSRAAKAALVLLILR
jgi:hypothetical protein